MLHLHISVCCPAGYCLCANNVYQICSNTSFCMIIDCNHHTDHILAGVTFVFVQLILIVFNNLHESRKRKISLDKWIRRRRRYCSIKI